MANRVSTAVGAVVGGAVVAGANATHWLGTSWWHVGLVGAVATVVGGVAAHWHSNR